MVYIYKIYSLYYLMHDKIHAAYVWHVYFLHRTCIYEFHIYGYVAYTFFPDISLTYLPHGNEMRRTQVLATKIFIFLRHFNTCQVYFKYMSYIF